MFSVPSAVAATAPFDDPDFTKTYPQTTSVYVEIGGTLKVERYFAGGGPDVLNDTRSATKSIVAMAAGIALRDGALNSLDTPLLDLLGKSKVQNDGPLKRAITLRDTLTMSSALDCDDNDEKSPGAEDRMHEQERWVDWGINLPVRADYVRDATGRGPFHYCTINAVLAGHAIGAAVKRPIQDYVQDVLFSPLGIQRAKWSFSPSGEAMTGGGTGLTTRDLAKLGRLVLDKGRWQDKQLIPESAIAEMLTPYREGNGQSYGLLMWRHEIPTACGSEQFWYMGGNGGNAVVIAPRLNLIAVVTRTRYNTQTMWMETGRLLSQTVFPLAPCPAAR
jgi:CubicO group peptidase (beta-lactamase class C family)